MINVFGSKVGAEELEEIKSSIDNQWLGMGDKVKQFEDIFSERLGQRFILIDNCSNGLYLAIKLLNLEPGSEVIVPTNTWISCASSVVLNNCIPVFADCCYDTLNVTWRSIGNVMTEKTGAIMVVHYAGMPADINKIKEHNLPVVEDVAHAVDSKFNGKWCGTLGDMGVYSFDSMKNIACGELGGFTSKDDEVMEMAIKSRYCGLTKSGLNASTDKTRWWEYELNNYCIKMLPNDISACIGLAQYRKLDELQKIRKNIYDFYWCELSRLSWLEVPTRLRIDFQHSYFTFYVRVKNGRRDELARYLLDNGIYTTVRYQPLHVMQGFSQFARGKLSVSEQFGEEGLNLPLHPNLSDEDVHYVIETIKNFK